MVIKEEIEIDAPLNVVWNGETLAMGMEFGASPMPETRREMVERGGLFGAPGFRWIPARTMGNLSEWMHCNLGILFSPPQQVRFQLPFAS